MEIYMETIDNIYWMLDFEIDNIYWMLDFE